MGQIVSGDRSQAETGIGEASRKDTDPRRGVYCEATENLKEEEKEVVEGQGEREGHSAAGGV